MRNKIALLQAKRKQGGYALLLVVFFTALLVVATMSVGLKILTEGQRQKEQEMIWRGKQYTRGIKLYYRKFGRFPTSMDDLTKPKIGNLRFMRQAYKDPMNKDDGSWRLIYVGPAGNLIGSRKPPQGNVLMPGAAGPPMAPGAPSASSGGTLGILGASGGSSGGPQTGTPPPGTGAPGGATGAPGTGQPGTGTGTTGTGTDPQPIPTGDTPTIVGGNIIGVGSKIDHGSVIVYETAKNYLLFEFIWDPSKDMGGVVGLPGPTQTGTPGTPGQSPLSPPQPAPPNPQQNPPGPPPNPNPPLQQP